MNFLQSKVNKGKDFTDTLKDVKDYVAFHQGVSVAMGTALQHLADSLFVNLSNIILLRRDSYLEHVKPGIKPDTLNNLRNVPMFGHGLFPDSVLATAEQDISKHESAGVTPGPGPGASQCSSWRGSARYRPYERQESRQGSAQGDQGQQPWRQFSRNRNRGRGHGRGGNPRFPGHEATNLSNDSYCVVPTQFVRHFSRLDQRLDQTVVKDKVFLSSKDLHHQKVACCQDVVNHVPSAILHGQLQNKGVGPVLSVNKIKVVKGVLCVNLLSSVPSVQNVPHVVTEISVGGRLQSFWQVWQEWGSNPRVVSVLRDGYSLPFRERSHLSRFPLIVSKYASPIKSKALLEALASLIQKKAVEKVVVRSSLAF